MLCYYYACFLVELSRTEDRQDQLFASTRLQDQLSRSSSRSNTWFSSYRWQQQYCNAARRHCSAGWRCRSAEYEPTHDRFKTLHSLVLTEVQRPPTTGPYLAAFGTYAHFVRVSYSPRAWRSWEAWRPWAGTYRRPPNKRRPPSKTAKGWGVLNPHFAGTSLEGRQIKGCGKEVGGLRAVHAYAHALSSKVGHAPNAR